MAALLPQLNERKNYETNRKVAVREDSKPLAVSQELQTKSCHSNPTGQQGRADRAASSGRPATRVAMSTEEDCECLKQDNGLSPEEKVTQESGGDAGNLEDGLPDSAPSEFPKAMYFWVLSRT